jgi:HlyD family secretion protein
MNMTIRTVGTILVLGVAGLLTACSTKESEVAPVVAVQVSSVKQEGISAIVTADSVLFPIDQATIVPKLASPVLKSFVIRGARVHRGQLLVTLENKDLAAAADENRGNLEQAQAAEAIATSNSVPEELQKAQLETKSAKENLDAQQKVYDSRKVLLDEGAIPRKDFDLAAVALVQAKAQFEQAQKHFAGLQSVGHVQELKSAKAQLASAEGKYNGAVAQLGYSEVRSPINGVVTDGPWYPGMMPQPGVALVTVMDLSRIVAKAHIPQTQAILLKRGDKATINAPGMEPISGKVTLVSPALDPGSTTVEVWAEAPNPNGALKAGASALLSMTAKTVPDALIVPGQALVTDDEGKKSLMVLGDDGAAHKREVETGIQTGESVQIVSGIKAGERVVTVGAYGLPDNTKVKVETPAAPGKESDEAEGKESKNKNPQSGSGL